MDKEITGKNDAEFICGIQNGDQELFAKLFHTHYSDLCTFALRYTNEFAVSEDIIQGLFLNIWFNRETWSPVAGVKSYLYKAARNKALDYIRHSKVKSDWAKESRYLGNPFAESPVDIIQDQEFSSEVAGAIDNAIKALPEHRKIIFLLSRENGLTYQEISDTLDISVKTVETQMGRSIKILREQLAKYLPALLLFPL
ncbi:MAG: RNA polymerase sigma-70 factor [Balneolales bacterium]